MKEILDKRDFLQMRSNGKVFRSVRRIYDIDGVVYGLVRVFDGRPETQGFYAMNANGHQVHLPGLKSWKQAEAVIKEAHRRKNGG